MGIQDLMNEYSLTPRELEIFKHISHGLFSKEIGRKLKISYRTVDIHRSKILLKLGAKNTAHAIYLAKLKYTQLH